MNGTSLCKKELRALVRRLKTTCPEAERDTLSLSLCHVVMADATWRVASPVLLYYPLADEVDVRPLILDAHRLGHQVLLPAVVGDHLQLRIYEGEASLSIGAFGIMEPTGPLFPPSQYGNIRLALVPGMAFDAAGHRLGRGRGYYDRLLPHLTSAHKVGICFPFQFLADVPAEPHDVIMDEVIPRV